MSLPKMPGKGDQTKKLTMLAKKIKQAGKKIAEDEINKSYVLDEYEDYGTIIVISDSGFEAILIGNVERNYKYGFMYLYAAESGKRNSFPSIKQIAELLELVLKKEKIPSGIYHEWDEMNSIEKQLNYFSRIVSRMAGIKEVGTIHIYSHYEYEDYPLFFLSVHLTEKERMLFIKHFSFWYGNTDQDTETYSLEFSIIINMLLSNSVVLNPKYLLLEEVLDDILMLLPEQEREQYYNTYFEVKDF